jgi:hypothetical protein
MPLPATPRARVVVQVDELAWEVSLAMMITRVHKPEKVMIAEWMVSCIPTGRPI